jgi:CheY-like chemotaxis protein
MKTLLLIEDDYLDVESVKRSLKKSDIVHILHVAHNGVDAIDMLTRDRDRIIPDIILLDINMPKMNGLEFLQIIKNYYSLKNIQLFIITTSSEEYDKMSTQHLGIAGYILKPLDFKQTENKDIKKLMDALSS